MPLYARPERRAGPSGGDGSGGSGGPHGGKPAGGARERLSGMQIRLLIGLYAGYSSMMFSRATLDVAIPLMLQDADTGLDPGGIGTLLTLCSFFYLFGKVTMGYGVDRCGARFVFLYLAGFASAGLTYMMSGAESAAGMTVIMCALCIAQSSGWAAMLSLVSLGMQPSQFAMAFGFLSTSSRMGDLASKLALGTAVADGWGWRSLFLVAAALQLAVAFANAALLPKHGGGSGSSGGGAGQQASQQQHATGAGSLAEGGQPHGNAPDATAAAMATASFHDEAAGAENAPPTWAQVRAVVTSPRFAAVAAAVAALHVVMEFDKYVPLYLNKSLGFPPGLAAQGASLYPLAQLLALGAAGFGYDRLTPRGRLWTTGGLCGLLVVFYSAQLALRVWAVPVPDYVHLGLIFCSGAAMAVPYYLPASIFLAEVGGKGKCGTLSGLLDASGGVAAMGFHSVVGKLASQERWGALLTLLTAAAVVGWAAIVGFHLLNLAVAARRERTKKDPDIMSTELSRSVHGVHGGGGGMHHHHHNLSITSSLGGSGSSLIGGGAGGGGAGVGEGVGGGLIPWVLGWLWGEGKGVDRPRKRRVRKDSGAVEDYHPLLDPQRNTFMSSHHLTV